LTEGLCPRERTKRGFALRVPFLFLSTIALSDPLAIVQVIPPEAMPQKVKKTAATPPASSKAISLSLVTPDKTYRAKADTIVDALEQLKVPQYFKGKCVIRVKSGKRKSEVMAYPFFLRRLFVNRIAREILQKRMAAALK